MSYLDQKQTDILKKAKLKERALSHPLRQKMLALIKAHNRIKVTDIYKKLRIEQSVASMHLAILRSAGFVTTQREGQVIRYSVNDKAINEFLKHCQKV